MTDGGFVFSPDLDGVMGKINEENRRVEEQTDTPHVSIAYLVPLPPAEEANELSVALRHELQGAYLAQYRANHTTDLGEPDHPLIRLLVANTGEGNEQWQRVVPQLRDMVDAPDRLVAVAGLGLSFEATRQAIAELAADLPVIAARLTADNLSVSGQDDVEGLVRVAPTNSDEAKAAAAYLRPDFRRALLIQDINKADLYAQTLGAAFTAEFPDDTHTLIERVEEYDASRRGVANTFVQMMSSICQQQPDVVYFAGRGEHLAAFVEALPGRTCMDFRLNVVTGDAAVDVVTALQQELREGRRELQAGLNANMTLRFTALAHPGAWTATPHSFSPASVSYFQDCKDCFKSLFPNESLDDDGAIMGHDAVLIAVSAIRAVAGQRDLIANPITPDEVIQQWNRLHDTLAVPGASGWISLDGRGNPTNKAIPILELKPDGTVAFVKLTAPLGAPFIPPGP